MAEEAVIESRHIAPHNQGDDARVIQLVAPFCNFRAMIRQGVIRGAHAEADDATPQEARKDEDIRRRSRLIARTNDEVQVGCGKNGDDCTGEMRPDVDGLVVQVQQRAGGCGV